MIGLPLFGAFSTLLLMGGGISALLLARRGVINLAEWLCLSWLLGVCSTSFLLWFGGIFLGGGALQSFVVLTAVLFAILGRRALVRFRPVVRIPRPKGIVEWTLVAILTMELMAIFWIGSKRSLGWDGLLVWEIKARYAFLNGGVLPGAYFQGIGRSFSHPEYPLAIPFTQLWLYLWLGEANQSLARIIFPVFYFVGSILLALLGKRLTNRRSIGLFLAIVLFLVPQASFSTGGGVAGYADFPLAIYYLATVGYLLCALREDDHGVSAPIFAVCLACLPWIKKEGAILWAVAACVAGLLVLAGRLPRRYLFALCPGLVVAASWRLFLHVVHLAAVSDFLPLSRETFPANLARLPSIYRVILAEVSTQQHWGFFWGVSVLALLFLGFHWRYLTERLLVIFAVIPFALYSGVYVLSGWEHYLDHVASSISRLLMQLVPVLLLGIGVVLAEVGSGRKRPVASSAEAA